MKKTAGPWKTVEADDDVAAQVAETYASCEGTCPSGPTFNDAKFSRDCEAAGIRMTAKGEPSQTTTGACQDVVATGGKTWIVVGDWAANEAHLVDVDMDNIWTSENESGWTWQEVTGAHGEMIGEFENEQDAMAACAAFHQGAAA